MSDSYFEVFKNVACAAKEFVQLDEGIPSSWFSVLEDALKSAFKLGITGVQIFNVGDGTIILVLKSPGSFNVSERSDISQGFVHLDNVRTINVENGKSLTNLRNGNEPDSPFFLEYDCPE